MKGGGSIGQSLHYVDPNAPERSAGSGSDLLVQRGLIARPAIGGGNNRKGGFFPTVMTGVVDNALMALPLAAMAGRRLLNNTRKKGGGRKGNQWKAQQEEAKAILKEIGNPSARNVLLYAAALRRNSAEAQRFLDAFRNKKVRAAEEFSAKRMAKEAKKEEKEAKLRARAASRDQKLKNREAKAAARADTKKVRAVKPRARKTAKVVKAKGKHMFFNNEGREIKKEEAERVVTPREVKNEAAAKKELAKPLKESQAAWLGLIDRASKQLKEEGIQSRANAMRLASLMKKGANVAPLLQNLRSKRLTQKNAKPASPKPASPKPASPKAVEVKSVVRKTAKKEKAAAPSSAAAAAGAAAAAAANNGTKKRKSPSAAQKAYFEALRSARATLGTMGKPKPANMARWASLKVSKKNNAASSLAAFETNFRSRAAAAPAVVEKPKGKAGKKALTAVVEANESGNSNEE